MLFSRAGGDDPDDFFSIKVLPICVDDQKHGGSPAFKLSPAEGVPALRANFYTVQGHQAKFVFKTNAANSNEMPYFC